MAVAYRTSIMPFLAGLMLQYARPNSLPLYIIDIIREEFLSRVVSMVDFKADIATFQAEVTPDVDRCWELCLRRACRLYGQWESKSLMPLLVKAIEGHERPANVSKEHMGRIKELIARVDAHQKGALERDLRLLKQDEVMSRHWNDLWGIFLEQRWELGRGQDDKLLVPLGRDAYGEA